MKQVLYILLAAVVVIAGCTKNNQASETPLNEMMPADTAEAAMARYSGSFNKGPYGAVTGTAKVYLLNGKFTLALENVSISNGPDLHVYLSKEIQPVNFIDLGKLKSTSGNQLYDIPNAPDFAAYQYALIHCQQYNHLFGSAALK